MKDIRAIILAAGEGTRMKSSRSKVLHQLFGKSIIEYGVDAVRKSGIREVHVVAGSNRQPLKALLGDHVNIVFQRERLGTGNAVERVYPLLKGFAGDLLVLAGDAPLIRAETLRQFRKQHAKGKAHASILTAELENPQGYGRILRDAENNVLGIREELDATPEEKQVREVNSSIYFFKSRELFEALKKIEPANRKGEYYLTDVIELFRKRSLIVKAYALARGKELLGINTRKDLAMAAKEVGRRNIEFQMAKGVTVVSPDTTYIESGVAIGPDTVIYPFTYIERDVKIGKNCRIGPFCKIRSGSRIKDGAVIGSFVEVVRSSVGENSLVKHLTYLGDATIGRDVNIGAGTVTANFDGKKKYRTRVGDKAFIGCDTVLIAPVSVGKGAKTGAGSVIPKRCNVPAKATVVGVPARLLERKRHRS